MEDRYGRSASLVDLAGTCREKAEGDKRWRAQSFRSFPVMFIGPVLCEMGCPETRQGDQISGLITYRVTGGGEVSPEGNELSGFKALEILSAGFSISFAKVTPH